MSKYRERAQKAQQSFISRNKTYGGATDSPRERPTATHRPRTTCRQCGTALSPLKAEVGAQYCDKDCARLFSINQRRQKSGRPTLKPEDLVNGSERTCDVCGCVFRLPVSDARRTCGDACKLEAARLRREANRRLNGADIPIATATVGAMGELLVAADLMRRGFNVFRALSPACPCDLVASTSNVSLRIEVRTAWVTEAGSMGFGWSEDDAGRSDHLAVVTRDGKDVYYDPELPNVESSGLPSTIPD